jgi:hypothetical protein
MHPYDIEKEKLDRLNRMMSEFEIARDLIDVYGGETVGQALAMLEAREAATIKGAVKLVKVAEETSAVDRDEQDFIRREPSMKNHIRGGGKIELNKNKSKIGFNGGPVKRVSSSFKDVVDAAQRAFNKIANENGELPWIKSVSQLNLNERAVDVPCVRQSAGHCCL